MTSIANKLNLSIFLINFEKFILLLFPIGIITGPAIPDSIITILSISFLFKKKKIKKILQFKELSILLIFYISILLTYLSIINPILFINSLIFIRFIFFIYNATDIFLNDKKLFKNFIFIFIGTYFFESIDVIFQYFYHYDFFGFPAVYFDDLGLYRLSGTFNDELVVGSYLNKTLPIVIFGCIYYLNFNKTKILILIIMVIILINLTSERSAFLLSIIYLFLVIFLFYKKKSLILLLIFIPVCILVFIKEYPLVINIYEYLINFKSSSYFELYRNALYVIKENIFMGGGYRTFERICPTVIELKSNYDFDQCSTHPHNTYLEITADYGLKSLFVFIIFYFYLIKSFFEKNKNINLKIMIAGLLIIFLPFIPSGSLFISNWNMSVVSSILLVYLYVANENKK